MFNHLCSRFCQIVLSHLLMEVTYLIRELSLYSLIKENVFISEEIMFTLLSSTVFIILTQLTTMPVTEGIVVRVDSLDTSSVKVTVEIQIEREGIDIQNLLISACGGNRPFYTTGKLLNLETVINVHFNLSSYLIKSWISPINYGGVSYILTKGLFSYSINM